MIHQLIETILEFLESILGTTYLGRSAVTFLVSMLPIIELRGAIPIGAAFGLPPLTNILVSIAGNMIPAPFIILFIRRIFTWMRKKSTFLGNLADRFEKKAKSKGSRLYRRELIGLMLFVAVPLPGTGAWTGSLIAALLDIRLKAALPVILAGVVIAGLIVTGITYGFISLIN